MFLKIFVFNEVTSILDYLPGGIHPGDQLMLVEWTSLIGLTLDHANHILQSAFTSAKVIWIHVIR